MEASRDSPNGDYFGQHAVWGSMPEERELERQRRVGRMW